MKKYIFAMIMGTTILANSCGNGASKLTSGIDMANLDTTVSPKDNFYQYACGGWMKNNPLTDEYARFGTFDQLRENNREQLKDLIVGLSGKRSSQGTIEQKIGDLYNMGMDSAVINSQGAEPIKPQLEKIASLTGINDLTPYLADVALTGSTPFFGFFGNADPDDSKQCIAWVWQSGLGIGDRDYYLDASTQEIRDKYIEYLDTILKISNYSKFAGFENREKEAASKVLALETEMAKAFMDKNTMRDPFATKNIKTFAELKELLPIINLDEYTKVIGLNLKDAKVNIGQVEYLQKLNNILKETDFNTIKTYLACRTISKGAPYLSKDFVDANFNFYGKILSGTKEQQPRWKKVVQVVENSLGEPVGQMYVEKYFPRSSKKRMIDLVNNLKVALKQRIERNSWMSDTTKIRSYEKLDNFIVKIGYPDKWRNFSKLRIDKSKSYYQNVEEAQRFDIADSYSKINKPVDPLEWHMTPQTVNAYYKPTTNEICFPAGILQPPFFDANADDAFNYGAIGVVIGHEMSHGFDDKGRNYDKDGNLVNWWLPSDDQNFQQRTQVLIDWFDAIEVSEGLYANGKFTLGENIADNGGVNISFEAMEIAQKKNKIAETLDNFSAEQRFFIAYAQVWASNIREQEIVRRTKEDPHSLGVWRVNATLPHIDAFAKTYGIKEGDKMYLAPDKRAVIW